MAIQETSPLQKTSLVNPFGTPVFHVRETGSTMQDARLLAAMGCGDGTAVYADYQSAGRGRIEGREWKSEPGNNLLCTTVLSRPPAGGFTLRVGLAVALTFESFLPDGISTQIKWPNDVLYDGKKLAGILCENDGSFLYVGTGLNIGRAEFPAELRTKATSLGNIMDLPPPTVEQVLIRYLSKLKEVLALEDWRAAIRDRLYLLGERISFLAGDPGRHEIIAGSIEGIGASGELLFRPEPGAGAGKTDTEGLLHLFSGEIPYGQ